MEDRLRRRPHMGKGGVMSTEDRTAAQAEPGGGIAADSRPNRERQAAAGRSAAPRGSKPLSYAVKQGARSALVMGSMPTSWARILPSFLIVGAQRAGTTSMGRTLCEHPAVS